jgi:pyruvate dehydrogenase complex dehydrogenase (E1) component
MRNKVSTKEVPDGIGSTEIDRADRAILRTLPRIVTIVADEARTFGMANLFRQIGIYSPIGQLYTPEDDASEPFFSVGTVGALTS